MPGQNGLKRRKAAENCEPGGTLPADDWSNRKQHCYANPMHKRIFFVFIAILAASAVMAQAYRWVDEDGIVHYSDRPEEGSERVELPSDNARPRPVPAARSAAPRNGEANEEEAAGPFRYDTLIISAPAAEETLWNIEGVLTLALDLRPGLQSGHQIRVYFDGEPRMVRNSSFQIDEVYRGVHNLRAEVVDETGTLLIRSLPNRFYVQQNSIGR